MHFTPGITLSDEMFANFIPDMRPPRLHVSMDTASVYEYEDNPCDWPVEQLKSYFEAHLPPLARFLHLLFIGDIAAFL